jgi:hypothetical protein
MLVLAAPFITAEPMAEPGNEVTRSELAWELVDLFNELRTEQINEVLAKNVPLETLEFFTEYSGDFGKVHGVEEDLVRRLPNLLLLGYLLHVLEERLVPEGESFDA